MNLKTYNRTNIGTFKIVRLYLLKVNLSFRSFSLWEYIINNECFDNNAIGILLFNSTNNIIQNNYIHDNSFQGIFLEDSSNNLIINNIIEFNYDWGILLYGNSNFNTVHYNTVNNNVYCIGEYDTCQGNDYLGNSCSATVLSDHPPPPPDNNNTNGEDNLIKEIPSYSVFIIIGFIIVISLILITRVQAYG